MKVRTTEELSDFLARELAWRKKELAYIKFLVDSAKPIDSQKCNTTIRCGLALLYAHWEGFTKAATSAYLDFVSRRRLPYDQLAANFLIPKLKSFLPGGDARSLIGKYRDAIAFFLDGLSNRGTIPWKNAIDTKSNLSSRVLRDIITVVGLDYSGYATKEILIDHNLLGYRNRIAHGEFIVPSSDVYDELHQEVIGLLELLRNQIDNAVILRAYIRDR